MGKSTAPAPERGTWYRVEATLKRALFSKLRSEFLREQRGHWNNPLSTRDSRSKVSAGSQVDPVDPLLSAQKYPLIQSLGSEWMGVTLDFGNNVSLLEEPMEVIRTLAPFAFSTHVKDMGVKAYSDGFLLSEVPLGAGIVDLKEAITLCQKYNPAMTFSLEMITRDPLQIPCLEESYWTTFENPSAQDLAKILRLVRDKPYPDSLPEVKNLSAEEKLAFEEENVLKCLAYSKSQLL